MESILSTIKESLGISDDLIAFDKELILAINSALMSLNQLGVGPENGFIITSPANTWSELLGESINLEAVKTYVFLKTRLVFDPPGTSHLIESINRQINELEWRITVQKEESEESLI